MPTWDSLPPDSQEQYRKEVEKRKAREEKRIQKDEKARERQVQKEQEARRRREQQEREEVEQRERARQRQEQERKTERVPPLMPLYPTEDGTGKQTRPPLGDVVVSSGAICEDYDVIGLVVGFASKSEGCGGSIPVEKVYQSALQRLIESAKAMQANGLIFVDFQNRVASQAGCGSPTQVFEVFAWGTAIRF
jgi:outer membrane biosynthesis protein TonB